MGRGLYIHIPFCRSKCLYCDFPSWAGREQAMEAYAGALIREMEGCLAERGRLAVDTVYVGGGTPSLLPPELMAQIMDRAAGCFAVAGGAEISMEANPGTVDEEKLRRYRAMGFNRLSLGLQAAQDGLLRTLGRIHDFNGFLSAAAGARSAGFMSIGADLMAGLPGQRAANLVESVRAAADAGCDHISLYTLKVEPGTPFASMKEQGTLMLPDEDAECHMLEQARKALARRGYERYEISNYARPGHACRHNLNYWDNGEYVGVGCGAASHLDGVRFKNTASLDEYLAAMTRGRPRYEERRTLSRDEAAFDTVMLALRTTRGLDLQAYRNRHGRDFMEQYAAKAGELLQMGMAVLGEGRFWLTEQGLDVQNQVLVYLLP